MAFTLDQQRDALIASQERFARESLGLTTDYCESRNILGVPSEKQRNVRYAEPWRGTVETHDHTVGWTTDESGTTVANAMTVYAADGSVTIKSATRKRAKSPHTAQREHRAAEKAPQGEDAYSAPLISRLAPIGDTNH